MATTEQTRPRAGPTGADVSAVRYLPLEKTEVLRYLGHRRGQELSDEMSALIDRVMLEVQDASRPRYRFRVFPLAHPELRLVGTDVVLTGNVIARHLAEASHAALLAGTLGLDIERATRRYEATDLTRARLLDACAAEYLEKLLDLAELELAAQHPQATLNRRFSPGYGDLPLVPTQAAILAALGAANALGITLTPAAIMVPRKSVTAVIGLFDDPAKARPVRPEPAGLTLAMARAGGFNIDGERG